MYPHKDTNYNQTSKYASASTLVLDLQFVCLKQIF